MTSQNEFKQIIDFIVEVEKLKTVNRMIKVRGTERHENSAEHSWQVALLATTLLPYADQPVDAQTVIKMLLIHDIVEIDTGDKFAYSASHTDTENETKAAKRLFSMLPEPLASESLQLWLDYEYKRSPEADFAYAIDRLMPVILNLHNNGQSWREHGISKAQVLAKNSPAAKASQALWQYIVKQLDQAEANGMFDYDQ